MNTPPGTVIPEAEIPDQKPSLVRGLSLLDSVLLLVSGIIGSSIFLTAKDIAGPLPNSTLFFLVWILGGVISLCACVAYGDLVAFLYGWMLFAVANGGTIAALSVASAAYMGNIVPFMSQQHVMANISLPYPTLADGHFVWAIFTIVFTRAHAVGLVLIAILTYVNVFGFRWGALLQNVSTWTKFIAMAVFIVLGFAIGKGHWSNFTSQPPGGLTMGLSPGAL